MNSSSALKKALLVSRKNQYIVVAAVTCVGGSWLFSVVDNEDYDSTLGLPVTSMEAAEPSPKVIPKVDPKPLPTRAEQIAKLKSGQTFDVLVVGGGATGSGAALDAQTRGLATALIERGDFGNETSARSTKLIWAGIRYLATSFSALLRFHNLTRPIEALKDFKSEFSMVYGCHKERRLLLESTADHLTQWTPIAVPIQSWLMWPAPFGHPLFSSAPLLFPLVFKVSKNHQNMTSFYMSENRERRMNLALTNLLFLLLNRRHCIAL